MVQLGWKAGPEQYEPVELLEYAAAADKAGYDWIDVSDHFNPWSEEGQASFTWSWLGAAATQTKRTILSPGVTCPILRYHPSVIAQAAATMTHLAPNRFALGLGTGEALNEFAATGQWPSYEERRARLIEAIKLMRELWSGEEVTFKGEFYQTQKARLFTKPKTPVKIIYSALAPHGAEFAGEYGDGLWSVGGKEPDIYKGRISNCDEGAKKAGKDPKTLPRVIELNVAYTDNIDAAIQEQQKYWAGAFIPALYDEKIYTPKMSQENGAIVGKDAIMKAGCFSPKIEDHIQYAKQHVDLGFDCLIFHNAGPDQQDFIERYANDVFPRLRSLGK